MKHTRPQKLETFLAAMRLCCWRLRSELAAATTMFPFMAAPGSFLFLSDSPTTPPPTLTASK